MTAIEKRTAVVKKYEEILGRNKYSQKLRDYCYKKYKDGKYYSDCSSSISYAYKEAGFSFGILNTVGMYNSDDMVDVPVKIENGIIQNPEILRPCDMLLFAGTDSSRASAAYVGHVEMVAKIDGNTVTIYGHGSGTPRATNMNSYCKSRQSQKADTKRGNKGLIKVRRFIQDDTTPEPEKPVSNGAYVMITGGTVNIREKPSGSSRKLGCEKKGTLLPARNVPSENGWLPVEYKGSDAWITGVYSKLVEVKQYVKIVNGNCYVRTKPNTDGAILGTVYKGTEHPYAGSVADNGWIEIEFEGKKGWVSGKYADLMES